MRIGVGHSDLVYVDDRQSKARPLHGGPVISHPRERAHACGHAAGYFRLSLVQSGTQSRECVFTEDRCDKEPIWSQSQSRLRKGADQVIRSVQCQHADNQICALRFKGKQFQVRDNSLPSGGQSCGRDVQRENFAQPARRREAGTERARPVENGVRKRTRDRFQPVIYVFQDTLVKEVVILKPRRGARSALRVQGSVKNFRRFLHRTGWLSCGGGVSLLQMISQMFGRFQGWGAHAAQKALDLAIPPLCPVTREQVSSAGMISPHAWGAIHFVESPYCGRCGVPFAADYGAEVECPSCIAEPPDFGRARAALVYDDATHRMIVGFKHGDRTEMAGTFGAWMARAASGLTTATSILTPIPLHPKRLLSRRFNQSLLLAREVAHRLGARISVDGLIRSRETPPQKDLSAEARRRNVSGAFAVRNEDARARFQGAHVVLVDDVLTTGATLSASARALKRAGAARVDALVLARVVKGGVGAI